MSVPPAHPELAALWMPYTANRQFKADPRLLVRAQGMHYWTEDGRRILDGVAGLWCVNAGHCRQEISDAVSRQIATLEFAPPFQMGHPQSFELARRLGEVVPGDLDRVFFVNSGSEAVDTALKIALAYHRMRGDAGRQRLIGREKGYHGVGFGGMSVGGLSHNRKHFGPGLPGVDHLRHTLDLEHNAFSRGLPEYGAHWADDLERLAQLHDPSTLAAVIVEPVAGSAGVVVPPRGYLQRLRALCDRYGALLIFDEVITGFGRLGAPFAAQYFDVLPDMITAAKGLTNAAVPMGAVFVRRGIHDAFMQGPEAAVELCHGYTYSGHPLACAAGLAALDIYLREGLLTRGAALAQRWADAVHGLADLPHVIDVRNLGLMAAVELEARPGAGGARGYAVFREAYQRGILVRATGDVIALSPPLIIEPAQIDELVGTLADVLKATA